jgi:hypothetical protein
VSINIKSICLRPEQIKDLIGIKDFTAFLCESYEAICEALEER